MTPFILNKAYVSTNPNFVWLSNKMDDSFEIRVDNKSVVVFGFNGIGKTSFAKCLKEDSSLNYRFLDYEEDIFGDDATKIVIAPNLLKIKEAENKIKESEAQIEFGAYAKTNGFKKTKAKNDPAFLSTFKSSLPKGNFSCNIFTNRNDYELFVKKHIGTEPKIFFDIIAPLSEASSSKTELDNFKTAKWIELIENSKQFVDSSNDCPVCGTHFDDVLQAIETKQASLKAATSELIETMSSKGYPCDSKTIDLYLSLCNELSKNQKLLNDYAIIGNDLAKYDSVESHITNISTNNAILTSLNANKLKKYNEIKNRECQFKNDVARYLKIPITSIAFNDSNCEIVITLDREVYKYSTGERHILWFIYQIYTFLGSDSPVLVLDDPASSLDLINMYKIAFEIVRCCGYNDKYLLVFTHSIDLVNAINSQRQSFLDIYYIEELNGKLLSDEIQYKTAGLPNVFTLERLVSFHPLIAKSLKKREDEGRSSLEHLVYHYDNSGTPHASQIDPALTNISLINLIDSFVSFSKTDFYKDVFIKILYLLALRVWLEKELFGLIPVTDTATISSFLLAESISDKISCIISAPTNYLKAKGIEKEDLMSKKVMLNQNAHYYSQIMPFAYAMNLSFDDLGREIGELKALFA